MSKRSGKTAKPLPDALKKEEILQAVVICDAYVDSFLPMSQMKPIMMFPLVNMTFLDYTLEYLQWAGVKEAILFCTMFQDEIKEYVKLSKWNKKSTQLSIIVIVSEGCRTFGDAMRDLDSYCVIKSDFILVSGCIVSNVCLLPILEYHKTIQKIDKKAVMTLLYKVVPPNHHTRDPNNDTLMATDKHSQRILSFARMEKKIKRLSFPLEIFTDNPEVELRFDLQDAGIAICSTSVPPLFADNFDFQTRDDFVRGILMNEEILESSIYLFELKDTQYAAHVSSWPTYQIASNDIIARYSYPFVPDSNFLNVDDPYMFLRNHIYKQKSVALSKGCIVEENVVIGSRTTIGENTKISHSVIGRNCKIGKDVTIKHSHIWHNVVIEDGCTVYGSVVGDKCVITSGVHLTKGCALGPGVTLSAPDKTFENVFIVPKKIKDKEEKFEGTYEYEQVSEKAFIIKHAAGDSESDDGREVIHLPHTILHSDAEESDDDIEVDYSIGSFSNPSPVPDDVNLFYTEVLDSLARGFDEKVKCDNLILEINSSRYAYNVTLQEVSHNVVKAILSLPDDEEDYFADLKTKIDYFKPLFRNYIKSLEGQINCLEAIEEVASSREESRNSIIKLLHLLYEEDVLEEDAILKWYEAPTEESSSSALRKLVSPFIVWLKEAEEESESDSN